MGLRLKGHICHERCSHRIYKHQTLLLLSSGFKTCLKIKDSQRVTQEWKNKEKQIIVLIPSKLFSPILTFPTIIWCLACHGNINSNKAMFTCSQNQRISPSWSRQRRGGALKHLLCKKHFTNKQRFTAMSEFAQGF